jgi:putative transposase
MRRGRLKAELTMSSDERAHLLAITRSRSLRAALTLRAKIVLASEREPSNVVVATRLGVGPPHGRQMAQALHRQPDRGALR